MGDLNTSQISNTSEEDALKDVLKLMEERESLISKLQMRIKRNRTRIRVLASICLVFLATIIILSIFMAIWEDSKARANRQYQQQSEVLKIIRDKREYRRLHGVLNFSEVGIQNIILKSLASRD